MPRVNLRASATRVGIVTAVLIIATAIYYPFSPGAIQRRNMDRAAAHLCRIQPILDGDPRFGDITAGPFTGLSGSIIVLGRVDSEQDLTDLISRIEATSPPVAVQWAVKVFVDADGSAGSGQRPKQPALHP